MNALLRHGYALLAIAGLMTATSGAKAVKAAPETTRAQLIVDDQAHLFTPSAIEKAKEIVAQSEGTGSRQVHIETVPALSPEAKKAHDAAANVNTFWREWAENQAKRFADRGVVVFIVMEPRWIEVITDHQMSEKGFGHSKEDQLRDIIRNEFRKTVKASAEEAQKARDAALIGAANYLRSELPTTLTVATASGGNHARNEGRADHKEGSNIMSYVCIGLAVLLGLWLIIGLFRAFTGGGGGGGGYGPGGGYGGGGGGGGFFSSLMGGLFGAAAGMYLYNTFMGDHSSSSAFGGDNYSGGDAGSADAPGAGDFSGDQGSGGDWGGGGDTGGGGGGDWGGGGDTGGGGDWGGGGDSGGGGDWGGGGGDF